MVWQTAGTVTYISMATGNTAKEWNYSSTRVFKNF